MDVKARKTNAQHGCGSSHHTAWTMAARRRKEYCSLHAKAGMIDVKGRRCAHLVCTKRPTLGADDGRKKPAFCFQHAKANMVSVQANGVVFIAGN